MADAVFYKLSDDGRNYVCAACGQVLPDGANLTGDPRGGVVATTSDGETVHDCRSSRG